MGKIQLKKVKNAALFRKIAMGTWKTAKFELPSQKNDTNRRKNERGQIASYRETLTKNFFL